MGLRVKFPRRMTFFSWSLGSTPSSFSNEAETKYLTFSAPPPTLRA